jgi:glycosyltransferase involved in cell wall biosynthesis
LRERYGQGHRLIGHFGTYGRAIRALLDTSLPILLASMDCRVLLMGRGSDTFRCELAAAHPAVADRLDATGALSADDVSRHVSACDVMLQPYPDGISSRRTTAMVVLSHGRPLITTSGHLTEPLWADSIAVVLVPVGDAAALAAAAADLLRHPVRRGQLAETAKALYNGYFDHHHTIDALRSATPTG